MKRINERDSVLPTPEQWVLWHTARLAYLRREMEDARSTARWATAAFIVTGIAAAVIIALVVLRPGGN